MERRPGAGAQEILRIAPAVACRLWRGMQYDNAKQETLIKNPFRVLRALRLPAVALTAKAGG